MNARVRISTNITPPLVFDTSRAPAPSPIMRWLAPTVDADFGELLGRVHYAPWGAARPRMGELVVYGLAVLVVVGAFTLGRMVLRSFR